VIGPDALLVEAQYCLLENTISSRAVGRFNVLGLETLNPAAGETARLSWAYSEFTPPLLVQQSMQISNVWPETI
jgi:hypothetical protein